MIITLLFCVLLIVLLWSLCQEKYKYWAKLGIKYEEGVLVFGSIGYVYSKKICFSEYVKELYQKYPNEKFVGFYLSPGTNALVVRDPELVKHVLGADFQYFHSRALYAESTEIEVLMKNLFLADGDLWKFLRQRLTPAFTLDKLKAMFPLIVERTQCLQ
ncbi:cytochrome P450 6d3-like [Leguminivora glycinivorella]|uniref:cytochrome P450 6d3-like n=1 Tax=Leguminivora glycinivorella TaxID=1035111 RepID=UPI00200F2417|nr:cytochrome P450 6d3-like [Leguminivora glycinivorella]